MKFNANNEKWTCRYLRIHAQNLKLNENSKAMSLLIFCIAI